jgi:hypothetical protein
MNIETFNSEFGSFFLAKYSTEGALLMVKTMPLSAQAFFLIKGVDTDVDGNIFVAGSIQNNGNPIEIDFDPGDNEVIFMNELNTAFFIVKYSGSGDFQFAKTIPGVAGGNLNRLIDLKLDAQQNIWITGEISGVVVDFDMNEGEFIVDEIGTLIFLGKYTSDGDFIFVKTIKGAAPKFCREIAIDASDNVYITGEFRDTIQFDSNSGINYLYSETSSEPFLAKYSNDGELIFAFDLDCDAAVNPRTIAADKLGYIYVSGYLRRSCDFDPSANEFVLSPQSEYEAFVAKYDEQGNFIYAFSTAGSSFTFPLDIDVNNQGVVSMTGLFRNTADFDPGTNNTQTDGLPTNTMFIAKYSPCYYANDEIAICDGEIYEASTRDLFAAGIYQVSYLSATGCDSIVTIDLTVNDLPNNGVFMDGDLAFVCEQSGAEYQWYDCETNDAISGATNQSFLPSLPGIYSVQITLNGCSVNSDCMSTDIVSFSSISESSIKIYPNPAKSNVFVRCEVGNKIDLLNLQGQLVYSQSAQSSLTELSDLPKPGVYFIRIGDSKNGFKIRKLILQ